MVYREVSRAIIYDDSFNVFLAKRSRGMGEGQWALIGGKPEGDEIPAETIVREVTEETGYTFEPELFKEEIDASHDPDGRPWRVSYFAGKVTGRLVLREENSACKYFPQEQLPELDIAFGHLRIIQEFLDTVTK